MDTERNLFVAPLRRRRRRRLGASLMAGSLAAGAVLATFGTASAQESTSVPDGAEPVKVEKAAFYEYPYSEAAPNTALAEFPPGVFCIVFPEAPVCQPNPVSEGVEGAIETGQENEQTPPESPVPPDTLPASLAGGEKRYESAVKFELPAAGVGEEIGQFTLVLTETQPTYHSSSPIFRRAVLAALACVRECDQQEEFQKVLEQEPVERGVLEVEVCPFTEPFEEGRSQDPPESQPVDCIFGATAQRIEGGEGKWVVDLTFAAQAWASGELQNHGILIRPTGAPNLAYGDPDATTNAQVTFTQELLAASEAQPAAEDPPAFGGGSFGDSTSGSAGSSGGFSADNGGGFSSAPSGGSSGSSGGFSSDPFSPPSPVTADEAAAAPEVAPGDDAGGVAADAPVAGPETEPASSGSAWWLWFLIPLFAAGSWLTAQSLSAEPVVSSGAGSRDGAMTRLIARNRAGAAPGTPMTQV